MAVKLHLELQRGGAGGQLALQRAPLEIEVSESRRQGQLGQLDCDVLYEVCVGQLWP